jgi:hypothetical protein
VVSFTPRPLYHRRKSPRYPLDRRLGGPQNRSGLREKEKTCPHRDSNSDLSAVEPVASPYTYCDSFNAIICIYPPDDGQSVTETCSGTDYTNKVSLTASSDHSYVPFPKPGFYIYEISTLASSFFWDITP